MTLAVFLIAEEVVNGGFEELKSYFRIDFIFAFGFGELSVHCLEIQKINVFKITNTKRFSKITLRINILWDLIILNYIRLKKQ